MQAQNFKNHTRIVPLYHFLLWSVLLAIAVLAILNFIAALNSSGGLLSAILLVLIALALLIFSVFIRTLPLVAQDRAIRAEENLRHFSLTGKLPDNRLTLRQIIALRFAPDNELITLTERAIKENLSPAAIKKAIREWREDHHRV